MSGHRHRKKYLGMILRNSPNIVMLPDSAGRLDCCSEKFRNLSDSKSREHVEVFHFSEIRKRFENSAFIRVEGLIPRRKLRLHTLPRS
jgi:hypothetical protein